MLAFALGLFLGTPLGFIVCSLLVANRLDPEVVKKHED